MPKTIISDTSCLIVLTNINELSLLRQIYGTIITTPEVAAEYEQELPDWIEIKAALDKNLQRVLELQIDRGESSAIALALEMADCTLILDDYKARKVAEKLRLEITGTIGVIIKAKLKGVIPSIRPYLDKIAQTNFRISAEVREQALKQAGE